MDKILIAICSTFFFGCVAVSPTPMTKYVIQKSFMENATISDNNNPINIGGANVSFGFWNDGGEISLLFENSTDEILTVYVDSSFCTLNGISYDFYDSTVEEVGFSSSSSFSRTTGTSYAESNSRQVSSGSSQSKSTGLFESSSKAKINVANKSLDTEVVGASSATTTGNYSSSSQGWSQSKVRSIALTGTSSSANHQSFTSSNPRMIMIPPNGAKSLSRFQLTSDFFEELYNDTLGSKSFNELTSPLRVGLFISVGNGSSGCESKEIVFYVREILNALEIKEPDPMAFYVVKPYEPWKKNVSSQNSLGNNTQYDSLYKGFEVAVGDEVKIKIGKVWLNAKVIDLQLSAGGTYAPNIHCSFIMNGREMTRWRYADSPRIEITTGLPLEETLDEPSE